MKWWLSHSRRREDYRMQRCKENEKYASAGQAGCWAHLGGREFRKGHAGLIPDFQSCGLCLTVRLSAETQHYAHAISLSCSCQPVVFSAARSRPIWMRKSASSSAASGRARRTLCVVAPSARQSPSRCGRGQPRAPYLNIRRLRPSAETE